jgi:hypothetical protein
MGTVVAIVAGATCTFLIVTFAIVAALRRLGFSKKSAVFGGGLLLPLLLSTLGPLLVFFDQSVDGPPPGMVIGGVLMLAAIWAAVAVPTSYVMVQWLISRESRNVR